jgi:mannose-6-phosphate isomerase-like protein (cupin superfamily)
MGLQDRRTSASGKLQILRREESLRSRQYRGVFISVIYEWNSLEILRTEMEPGSELDDREIGAFPVVHFVIQGRPVFMTADQTCDLIPGDSIALRADENYRISNAASSRSIILTILDMSSEQGTSG